MTQSIRIGIIGANFGAQHARAFASLEKATVVAIADPNQELRQAIADELSIPAQHDDASELILSGELDAVVVSSPTYMRERHVGQAFDAGLHVLCDSPVGIDSRQASHLVTSAGLVGKTFMASNPLRFDPRISEAARLAASGQLGDLFAASVVQHTTDWSHVPESWRLDAERGGGALLENGLPSLDALWYAMGCPDAREALAGRYDLFSAKFAQGIDRPAEDSLSGALRFKNGAALQISTRIKAPLPQSAMLLHSSEGVLDLQRGIQYTVTDPAKGQTYAQAIDLSDQLHLQASAFLQAIVDDQPAPYPGKQILALGKMLDGLLLSGKEKQAVSIKVERSLDDLFGAL